MTTTLTTLTTKLAGGVAALALTTLGLGAFAPAASADPLVAVGLEVDDRSGRAVLSAGVRDAGAGGPVLSAVARQAGATCNNVSACANLIAFCESSGGNFYAADFNAQGQATQGECTTR